MPPRDRATLAELKKVLRYDPHAGLFFWKISTNRYGGKTEPGDPAGTLRPDGYIQIGFNGHFYRAHRLAYWFIKGELPSELDHKNGNRSDNRWSNLRLVTRSQNNHNPVNKLLPSNKSGHRGVSWRADTEKWHARIQIDGQIILLGDYSDKDEAIAAREEAERQHSKHRRSS